MPPPPSAKHCVPPPASSSAAEETEAHNTNRDNQIQCNTNISYIMVACFDWWAYTAEVYQHFLQEGYQQIEGFVVEKRKDYIAKSISQSISPLY
jgi:hypothetical protein